MVCVGVGVGWGGVGLRRGWGGVGWGWGGWCEVWCGVVWYAMKWCVMLSYVALCYRVLYWIRMVVRYDMLVL